MMIQMFVKACHSYSKWKVIQLRRAENGQEALHKLNNTDRLPLLVVLDLTMPTLDGPGFLQQRARDPALANIPVIVVSGSRPDEALSEVEVFLQKPIEITRLLESIRQIEAREGA
jgi:CheY-like chemotaxis protein